MTTSNRLHRLHRPPPMATQDFETALADAVLYRAIARLQGEGLAITTVVDALLDARQQRLERMLGMHERFARIVLDHPEDRLDVTALRHALDRIAGPDGQQTTVTLDAIGTSISSRNATALRSGSTH